MHGYFGILPIEMITALGSALFLCLQWQRVSTAHTGCTASAAVEGYSATITCNFAEDLSHRKHFLNVLRYDFDGQQHFPDLMASCYWENFDSPVPTCTTSDGVRLEGKIGKHATIAIDKVTARHAGVYKCNHALADRHDLKTCHLHVRGNMTSCTDVTVNEGEPTSLTCNFNSDLSKTHDAFSIIWYPARTDGQEDAMQYKTAASCNWLGPDQGWICHEHGLFYLSSNITDTVRLNIKRATLEHSGAFACSVLHTTHHIKAKRCLLTVKKNPTMEPTSAPKMEIVVAPTKQSTTQATETSTVPTIEKGVPSSSGSFYDSGVSFLSISVFMAHVVYYLYVP